MKITFSTEFLEATDTRLKKILNRAKVKKTERLCFLEGFKDCLRVILRNITDKQLEEFCKANGNENFKVSLEEFLRS